MVTKKPSPPPKPTPESKALADAIAKSGLKHPAIGEAIGVSPAFISHVATGRRPVPAEKAEALAQLLDTKPELISLAYANDVKRYGVAVVGGASVDSGVDSRRPDQAMRRVENDVQSLRYAVGALVGTMVLNRPREAKEVADVLRKKIPKKFRERGFVWELLQTLDAVK